MAEFLSFEFQADEYRINVTQIAAVKFNRNKKKVVIQLTANDMRSKIILEGDEAARVIEQLDEKIK